MVSDFLTVFARMAELMLVIVVGYIANKTGFMDVPFTRKFSSFVLNFTIPGLLLGSVLNGGGHLSGEQFGAVVMTAVLSYCYLLACAVVLPKFMRLKADEVGAYRFMLAFGNVGFIGFPVVVAVFGLKYLVYAVIFNIPFNVMCFTVGVMFLKGGGSKVKFDWKLFVSPCLAASVLTVLFSLVPIPVPKVIGQTCELIGQVSIPASLTIIGSTLAEMPLRDIFRNAKIYLVCLLRLLAIPTIWLLFARHFIADPILLGVSVLIIGMPVAANGTMFCYEYGGDLRSTCQGTFLTTLFSAVTIPCLCLLLRSL